ncbi:MAG: glycosyltransferase involved in cell wall biosynthesis [Algoriphagus sp.]|jgi:glycosyltransferase involved in cell wall biosynthesis
MTNPRFSICIPNFNYENYIEITIDSVLNQDFTDFEIIIVDNASTDGSWKLIEDYVAIDQRIKTFKNGVNIGFAPNLQEVTTKATGEFILLLSSDDLMRPGALSKMNQVITDLGDVANRSVIHTGSSIIDENGKEDYSVYRDYSKGNDNPNGFFSHVSSNYNGYTGEHFVEKGQVVLKAAVSSGKSAATFCATFFSRTLWEEVGGYDVSFQIIPDTIFLYRLLNQDSKMVYVHEKLFDYRIHSNNQLASVKGYGPLKTQLDGYLFLIRYSDSWFAKAGMKKEDGIKTFLKQYCANESLISMSTGNVIQAARKLNFGFACYPKEALITGKYYVNWFLILLYPISYPALLILRKLRNKI